MELRETTIKLLRFLLSCQYSNLVFPVYEAAVLTITTTGFVMPVAFGKENVDIVKEMHGKTQNRGHVRRA